MNDLGYEEPPIKGDDKENTLDTQFQAEKENKKLAKSPKRKNTDISSRDNLPKMYGLD